MIRKQFLLILLLFLLFSSCNNNDAVDLDNYIKDDAGNLFQKDVYPKKIISLAPNITETIYALKADSILVGVTDYCDYPPEAKTKNKVGSMLDPNIEKITALSPDIIFLTTEGNSKYTYLSLKNNGFKVYVANPNDINGIIRMITNMGIILDKKNNGQRLSEKITDERKYYTMQKGEKKPESCLMIISMNPLITVNKFTYINELLDLSGFDNVYKDEIVEYPNVTYESVFLENPDYIFYVCDTSNTVLLNDSRAEIIKRLNLVNACKNNRVFGVDENVMSRPGPRVMDAVKLLRLKVL
jgi:iron complex transport system substrate-binding protein